MVSRTTGVCRQPELRPDLTVRRVTVTATASPGVYAYDALLANRGASATGPFAASFVPGGGAATKSRSLAGLAAFSSTTVRFLGGPCSSASPPIVTADPDGQVDDFDRTNNRLTVVCPAAT
jgi:hypothetical protein